MSLRARTDLWLTGKIEGIHRRSRGVYGSPNIHAELADDHGIRVGRKRVARLMRVAVMDKPQLLFLLDGAGYRVVPGGSFEFADGLQFAGPACSLHTASS
jgi:transposase InsO family protein